MKSMLKKVLLVSAVSLMAFSTQAKEVSLNNLNAQEKQAFQICSMLSYLNYNAMEQYQKGATKKQNEDFLNKKFTNEAGSEQGKQFFKAVIGKSLDTIYTLPKGKDNAQKEQYAKELSIGVMRGCAEEYGLDLNKISVN